MGDPSQPVLLLLLRAELSTGIFGLSGLTCGGNADDRRGVCRVGSQECSVPSPAVGEGTPPEAGAGVTGSRAQPTDSWCWRDLQQSTAH